MYLVLASKSPRRRELLTQAGFQFQINVSNVDETVEETNPVDKVLAIAKKKGLDIYNKYNDDEAVILSADTIVVINNDILGKPKDKEDARLMIKCYKTMFITYILLYLLKVKLMKNISLKKQKLMLEQ